MIGTSTSNRANVVAASVAAALGLIVGGVSVLWVAGAFALNTATATAIWNAFEVGGWALSIALAAFSGGVTAAIYGAIRGFVATLGKKAARKAFIA